MLCCTNSSVRWSEIIRDQSASQTSPWREQFSTMNVLKDQLPNVVHCKETLLQNSPSKGQPCFLVKILIKPVYLFNTWEITFSKKNVPYEYQLVVRTNATVYRNQTSSRGWFDWLGRSWIYIRWYYFMMPVIITCLVEDRFLGLIYALRHAFSLE